MDINITRYLGQTYYAFTKLKELSFEKGKPYNLSLVAGLKALISTLKYEKEPADDIAGCVFKLGVLLKRSRLFISTYIDQ